MDIFKRMSATQNTFEICVDTYGGATGGGGGGYIAGATASVVGATAFVSLPVPSTAKLIIATGNGITATGANIGIYIQDGLTGFGADVALPIGSPAAVAMQAFSPDSQTFVGFFSVGETYGDPAQTDMIAGTLLQPVLDVQIGGIAGDLTAGDFQVYYQ